jgi:phosphoglycerate dehydrogenase-like enzyme
LNILFASETEDPGVWLPQLRQALPKDRFTLTPEENIDVVLIATPPAGTFEALKRLKLVQSLWMGVERLLADPAFPKGVPLARLVDPGMVAAMSETVLAHVLDWHRHHHYYRGGHLVAEDLIEVLDAGRMAHAYLDVFEHEPLPHDHPLWTHPAITITPHAAALTEPRTAVPRIVENIERLRRGEPPHNLVDFDAGY